ncbi:MAG: trimeric intracellular cation channel family protein [Clostridiales bacterium]|nr:trimeric intracellular cation channel family protein [Clostridiales bacterium]
MSIISFFEPIGILVFALSGALAARERKMDLFGILMLATLTATGGGIIRDVVMDNGIPMFFRRPSYMVYILAACLIALTARQLVLKAGRLIIWLDAVGLACFAIDAGSKVIDKDLGLMAFLFVAVTSGVGGGVLRDLLSQQVPTILTKDIYAVAALIGSLVYYLPQDSPCIWLHPTWG